MKQYKDSKGIKAKPDRPDAFTPVSCVPWVSFTSVGHDTPGPRQMYFPIIVFGRYHEVHDRWMLPFSIMVNHAVADGYHTSMLIHDIQEQWQSLQEVAEEIIEKNRQMGVAHHLSGAVRKCGKDYGFTQNLRR